jgi:predicted phosphohydrolase
MLRVNLAQVEQEMRILAEERIRSIVGDAPMLTRAQTARVWGKSPAWVKAMQAAGRVPTVPFGHLQKVPRAVAIIGLVKGV